MSSDCEHIDVQYEQSHTALARVMFVLHKFVCTECRQAARVVDRFDDNTT